MFALPLFLLSYNNINKAPVPPLPKTAKKLNNENPVRCVVTPMYILPVSAETIPGSIAPGIQPTLNVKTNGSFLVIFVPSGTVFGSGKEYAVDAIKCDGSSYSIDLLLGSLMSSSTVWKRTLMLV